MEIQPSQHVRDSLQVGSKAKRAVAERGQVERSPGVGIDMPAASRRRNQALDRARAIAEARQARGENALGHTGEDERRMALLRLTRARAMVCHAYHPLANVARGMGRPADMGRLGDAVTVVEALQAHCEDEHAIAPTYARRALERITREPVAQWEAHPLVTQDEALRVLDAAIVLLGGEAPRQRPRSRRVHRGGWVISAGGAR